MSDNPSTLGPSSPSSAEVKSSTDAKPVKLRSACNCCFTAKVRCDGNKEGCNRCAEKHLECTYSISRVGKVVGKRRKRPLPDAETCEPRSNQWSVAGPAALPSPTSTNGSDRQFKGSCVSADWTNFASYDHSNGLDFSNCEEQFLNLEMTRAAVTNTADDMSYMLQSGLPTPSMSPPDMRYLSPLDLETVNRSNQLGMLSQSSKTSSRHAPTASIQKSERASEDNDTVCIKLLAHLKRLSQQEQSCSSILALVQKTNAALTRLIRSRSIQVDYSCHLLLTNIVLHLASFCERYMLLSQQKSDPQLEAEFVNDSYLVDHESDAEYGQQRQDEFLAEMQPVAQRTVAESLKVNASMAELLKRKPSNGFQVLGRHESAHVEIDLRLRQVLSSLS